MKLLLTTLFSILVVIQASGITNCNDKNDCPHFGQWCDLGVCVQGPLGRSGVQGFQNADNDGSAPVRRHRGGQAPWPMGCGRCPEGQNCVLGRCVTPN